MLIWHRHVGSLVFEPSYQIWFSYTVFDFSKKQWGGVLGASRIFCVGAQMEAPTSECRRREDRGTEGGRVWGGGTPLPSRLGGLGSVISSPSGVWDGAPAANDFKAYFMVRERLLHRGKNATFCLMLNKIFVIFSCMV